ncbi:MAG: DUF3108 domain-containing protein [Bacteroidales bacterium]|nr:DUF3108 domain-containing protein [Bacteroidales bacterium]
MGRILIILSFCFLTLSSFSQLRKINNTAFQRGEVLTYRAYYDAILTGKVTAGEATLEITNENRQIAGRNTFRIVGTGASKGAFNLFFKVYDRYETIIDEDAIIPWIFIRRVNEGGFKIDQDVVFNQFKNIATSNNVTSKKTTKNVTTKVKPNIQDIISLFYYARTFDVSNIKIGDEFSIDFFIDDSVYVTKLKFLGKETVKTSLGKFNCLKFKPLVLVGNFFKEPYPMTLYITDDKNHIPVLAESAVIVGKVKLELIKYSGLKNPMTSKVQ